MIKNGYQNNCFVASVLLTLYANFGELGGVEKLFRRIGDKDITAWNSMILAGARPGHGSSHSMQLLQELCQTTLLQIESATWVAVLKSCENESDLVAGRQIMSLILKSSLVGNALVHIYSVCRLIDDAFKAFVDIEWKDDSSRSSIIGTYKQNDMELEALGLCKEMLNEGVNLTSYSLPLCFSACSQLSAICEGKQLHVLAIKSGYNRDVYVGSSIIDMYAKCGNIEESENVFSEQLEPNEVIFNAMICGYAHHGKAQQAIEVFSSYYCVLDFKGDRNISLVDESRPCDQSVINGQDDPHVVVIISAVDDRSQLVTLAGVVTR
ncbi:unnamed protein product [Vicia faba]|uniref:Pentatricopeptide repeat-containing protein n=1 Tax=Vicia faba TaxID=3906 RepID=A0AAV0YUJ8_VICFA|nr:unnamed protein product [Vicia faba]